MKHYTLLTCLLIAALATGCANHGKKADAKNMKMQESTDAAYTDAESSDDAVVDTGKKALPKKKMAKKKSKKKTIK